MVTNQFYRLAPFLQEWIYAQGWVELRPVQIEACKVLFDTPHHLLLATGTASGKTEAALLPALTLLQDDPSATLGILYIGPLKALINDQFSRVEDLLQEAHINVWRWHGDVPQSHKTKLIKNPNGILQITPESMESLLLNRTSELRRLFGDLRFVVIDEVHSFMSSDRGRQVLSQLERLQEFIMNTPRRIGLSATLADYSLAEEWLASGTNEKVITPKIDEATKRFRLAVEHFFEPTWVTTKAKGVTVARGLSLPSHLYVFEHTLGKKCIIFSNTRETTELTVNGLREIAEAKGFPDRYHAHHSCIAALLRESAESSMKEDDTPDVTCATLTLELGMDIGGVERIIHVWAPHAVSSFVQRLGRSGRRSGTSEMIFALSEDPITPETSFPRYIPWYLLQTIAIIQLYLEEQWIEPAIPVKKPFSLLYQQTMSILASLGELSPAALAKRVLTLTPFKNITQDEFRTLLLHLIEEDHIQTTEEDGLILGLNGEKIVRNYRFYAVFRDYAVDYSIKEGTKELGHIDQLLSPGEIVLIAGNVYEVTDVYPEQKLIMVRKAPEKALYVWPGRRPDTHWKVLQRMRQVLFEDDEYSFLQVNALKRLKQAREYARKMKMDQRVLFRVKGEKYCLFPWMGTTAFRTLYRIMKFFGKGSLEITKLNRVGTLDPEPYFLRFESTIKDIDKLQARLASLCNQVEFVEKLLNPSEKIVSERYDQYLPIELQQKAFLNNFLNLDEAKMLIQKW